MPTVTEGAKPTAGSGHGGERAGGEHCDVRELFAMLGQPHMLSVLAAFRESRGAPIRFSALEERLGIAPKTLAARLRLLVAAGFLERRTYRETPPRVEYAPTERAAELDPLFEVMAQWAGRHSLPAARRSRAAGPAGPGLSAGGQQ